MHENAWGRATFLSNLMFCGLDKFDGPILEGDVYTMGGGEGGAYIQDVN